MDTSKIFNIVNNMVYSSIPGASAAVIQENKVQKFVNGNSMEFPVKRKLLEESYYDLASLTKLVATTTRIFQLIENGSIGLKTSVKSIIPDSKFPDVTIKNLLMHNSGLPADIAIEKNWGKKELEKYILTLDKEYKLGQKIIYSDIGYILLGWIIEKIDGVSLQVTCKEHIFKPLEMVHTDFCIQVPEQLIVPTEVVDYQIISGVVHDDKTRVLGGIAGSAGLFSTLEDLSRFCIMMMNEGTYNNVVILHPTFLTLMKNNIQDNRTLGWEIFTNHNKEEFLYHTGFTGTSILINTSKKESFILLTNRVHPNRNNEKYIQERNNLIHSIISKTD